MAEHMHLFLAAEYTPSAHCVMWQPFVFWINTL